MEKDYDEEIEEIDDELEQELTKEELELLEIEKEQSTKLKNGQVEFKSVNHSERAAKFGRASDGDTTKYVNIALEYFGHRCALSGEKFETFDKKVDGKKSNLSAEHIVALCLGGDDIVPNIVPTVLQYNLRKNGYYLLDYWDKQKDTDGKNLYSPYRLLKLVNYMMKSIEARDLKSIKDYRKAIMTPNEIDEFLAEIEQQDELETDNSKKKIHSDTITATTVDEDNKKILTEVPQVEGNIPTQREQQERFRQNEIDMMDIFLSDAVGLLKSEQELQQVVLQDKDGNEISLQDKLDGMLQKSIKEIRFEVEVRNAVLQKLETLSIKNNKYSVANDLINNTEILKLANENRYGINSVVNEHIEKAFLSIDFGITNEQKIILISNNPALLYDSNEIEDMRANVERYIKYIGEDIDFKIINKTYLKNILAIKDWMEERKTTQPPSRASTDIEEKKLGQALSTIRKNVIKLYMQLQTGKKEKYREEHPELEEIMRIVEEIDRNNISVSLANAREIKTWMEKRETTKPPSRASTDIEEKKLGQALSTIRRNVIKPYMQLETEEEKKEYREKHPKLEEIMQIVEEIDRNNISVSLANARGIKKWMEERETIKPPSSESTDIEEKRLGTALSSIRQNVIKPYMQLKTEEEREKYEEEHPEIEEIMQIVEKIDRNNISVPLVNARKIKKWMEERETTKPPSSESTDIEEKRLGIALRNIRMSVIKPYTQLKTEEEKETYREEHPELEEIMQIVEEIDRNNISLYLANAREIKKWMEERETTKPPSSTSRDLEEKKLGIALRNIRMSVIKPYTQLKTEEEKEKYMEEHSETEEIMELVEEIDRNNIAVPLANARRIKKWMEERKTTKPPSRASTDLEEKRLGRALETIRRNAIKPYTQLKTEEEKEKYMEGHPELEEIMQIIEEIDRNNIPVLLANAREIKKWMGERKTTKPPSLTAKDREEKRLGRALSTIRKNVINLYMQLQTEEEKEEYREEHPELEEIMQIVEEIDRNNISLYLVNAREIKKWMEERETTKPPSGTSRDLEEKRLGKALSTIRYEAIKPYMQLQTEEEKKQYKKDHAELEEVMEIVQWIDAQKSTKKKVKQTVVEQKNKGELGQNQQIESEVFEETIRQAEQIQETETSSR